MTILEHARAYLAAGLCVFPVKADGSKAPALPAEHPVLNRQRLPTDEETVAWWGAGTLGIAVACGPISGNLVVIDFDDDECYRRWVEQIELAVPGFLSEAPIVKTPSGGHHVYYRSPEPIPFTQGKLASRASEECVNGTKPTLIETRINGYVLAPGSPPACHETGRPYEWESRGWFRG